MAKINMIARDTKRKKLVDLHAAKRAELKKAGDSCKVRMRNRCKLTGRPRGYMRDFGISRVTFREMVLFGLIPGVTKSSF
jgi:small subunit ribosomal protein S14